MLMMRPNLRWRMPSITGRHMLNNEFKLVLITWVHCSRRALRARAREGINDQSPGGGRAVSSYDACAAGLEKVGAEVGPVDILVNNAGITRDTMFHRMTPPPTVRRIVTIGV
jgi:NAD(P)-dependent dehydrogenase (short-subunit alcohol dehydrogenase family)